MESKYQAAIRDKVKSNLEMLMNRELDELTLAAIAGRLITLGALVSAEIGIPSLVVSEAIAEAYHTVERGT